MAQNQSTSTTDIVSYIRGMVKDTDDSFTQKGAWYHARNLINYSKDGNEGTVSNEPSNTFCNQAPFTIIGAIHLNSDRWAIFSTDNTLHEIGVFEEDACVYNPLRNCNGQPMNQVNCLGFNQNNIIIGVSKENFDCSISVYFADKLNPDRIVNIEKAAFVETCQTINNCLICHCTQDLDCDALRLAPLVTTPCLRLSEGPTGGTILNGSYYAIVAYVVNSQRVTDYYMPSNTQAIFDHDNVSGSLQITIDQMDTTHFDYFELVIVRFVNSQTSAKKIGIYSTRQVQISIDNINEALESIPVEHIPLRTPNYEKSDGIFEIGNYMVRTGPRSKFDFNYQPLANRITTKWQAIAYPSSYYADGGNSTGYFRDEVYPYFIRWVYTTAERSSSYHIPGRPALLVAAPNVFENSNLGGNTNALDLSEKYFEVFNSAPPPSAGSINSLGIAPPLPDGGVLIAEGNMAYWESTESYPDKKPDIFNASSHPWSALAVPPAQYGGTLAQYDLCGNPIRHHKFPDNKLIPHYRNKPGATIATNPTTGILDPTDSQLQIIVLGVAFDNILPPVDNNGVLIPGIVGYEILRGSREGNKTIIAKGMINNMRRTSLDSGEVGLYQNYPYNPLGADESLTSKQNDGENPLFTDNGALATGPGGVGLPYSQNAFTFHSPETSFNHPFLSSKELKVYGELYGNVLGNFDESPKHPKEKLVTDVAFAVAAIIGIGAAIIALKGKNTVVYSPPIVNKDTVHATYTTGTGFTGPLDPGGTAYILAQSNAFNAAFLAATNAYNAAVYNGATLGSLLLTGDDVALTTYRAALKTISTTDPGNLIRTPAEPLSTETNQYTNLPGILGAATHVPIFAHYWTLGTDAAMDLILSMIPYTQYAMRYTSHGFSNQWAGTPPSLFRFTLSNALYLNDGIQDFGFNSNAKINNINRGRTVAIQTINNVLDPTTFTDNTAQTIGSAISAGLIPPYTNPYSGLSDDFNPTNVKTSFSTRTISHYSAIKQRMRNQYGQLHGIIQVPVSTCLVTANTPLVAGTVITPSSGPLFNGDIYIGRFTEKNTFFYFWDWLYDQPEGFEFNYQIRQMQNYARYWADFTKFDASGFINTLFTSIIPPNWTALKKAFPSGRHSLDGPFLPGGWATIFTALLRVTNRYFYLFQSGVRDFLVESEINIDLRDWEDPIEKRFYDTRRGFTDLRQIFEPKIIKSGNFYKYDQSLSISRLFNNFFSWGNLQDRDYDPLTAETCYVYYKKRVIYSLPQNLEAKKDYWRVFLANNYKDFKSKVTAISPINKSGAMFFFYEQAPIMYQGVDTLQTDLGTKITIGDGGLFSQPEQAVINADESYEYGSCQNRLSVANTPVGLFWIGENQGKIFKYSGSVQELSAVGMKFWFSRFLPYQLTQDFPNFDITDNPVAGIGCQSIFNNRDTILYFAKKDFKLRSQFAGQIVYVPGTGFLLGALIIKLGDPVYFEDASWTLSFDPKTNSWQSFHDWHPDLMFPSKSTHLTTKLNGIWKHTDNQTSFCKFYGVDYPFELDYISQTGQTVEVIRSIEYFMEAHIYKQDKTDFYHVLDYNFDHAVIYNSEQVSGTLILNDTPKNNVAGRLLYPIINPTSIDILYDKVEQKYRFNQFWDITADRGEYTYPNVQRQIWQTESNGYIRSLNPANLNYNKLEFQRKKFRHYASHVLLYKNVSNNIKMLMKFANNKELVSFR